MRAEYGSTGRLVDVAALESTTPDGRRVSGTADGQDYFALYEGYASDNGHLNATGGQVVAQGLLSVLADNLGG
jgi:lysophospholipase L1-like esterase